MALTKAYNPKDYNKHTSAYAIIGDSKLERDLGVADGFPNMVLKKSEVLVIEDLLHVLDLKEGDNIELNFDLF